MPSLRPRFFTLASLCALGVALSVTVPARAAAPLRVAIYAEGSSDAESLLPLARALARAGHLPLTIDNGDLAAGRLVTGRFDAVVLPEGRKGFSDGYDADLGATGLDGALRDFVAAGGGFVGLGAGARYAAAREVWDGTAIPHTLGLWPGTARGPLSAAGAGLLSVRIEPVQPLGTGLPRRRTLFAGYGAAFFEEGSGETVVVRYDTGRASDPEDGAAAVIRFPYGSGRCLLSGPLPALDPRSEGDWAAWDDRVLHSYDGEHDAGLLVQFVEWAAGGEDRAPSHLVPSESDGRRAAVYATRSADGGAYPALLTALARAIEFAGLVPLAIRDEEVFAGALDPAVFDLVVFPGGWAPGYVAQLAGAEPRLRDFVARGGGYAGISAGAYYAADTIAWEGQPDDYPLDLFLGSLEGPLDDIAPWPGHALTPLAIDDPAIAQGTWMTWYQGEGSYTLPDPAVQAVTVVGTYANAGPSGGSVAVVRHAYGAGRAIYPNLHLEVEEGSERDWMFAGDNDANGPVVDPDSEWDLLGAMLRWTLPAQPAARPARESVALPVRFAAGDTSGEPVTELQDDDARDPLTTVPVRGDGRVTLLAGETLVVTGFGEKTRLALPAARLEVETTAASNYGGTGAFEWSIDGAVWHATSIVPRPGEIDRVATEDLGAAGVASPDALRSLRIRFRHTAAGGGPLHVDRIWVRLAPDEDGDGAPDASDCAPGDPGSFAAPGEPHLTWRDRDHALWDDLATSAGEGTLYDAASGSLADLRADGGFDRASCTTAPRAELALFGRPAAGDGLYVVTRARNSCGTGSWGGSRAVPTCP